MAKIIHLPKQIREDERIQKVFGDSKPTPKGYGSWQEIRQAWVMKQKQRICENPNCKKPYFPQTVSQRFCTQECYRNSKRKGKPIPTTCKQCGRHSSYLQDGLCSFCYANHRKAIKAIREEKELSRNRCKNCGKIIYANCPQNIKFRLCGMCFDSVHHRPICPKCGKESFVRLSTQESSDPKIIIWFCSKCSYVFPQSIGKVKR